MMSVPPRLGPALAVPLMRDGQSQPQLDQVASLQYGTMPEMIERLSGQRIVSVTANLHGIALGDAQKKIEAALKGIAAPPKGSTVAVRGLSRDVVVTGTIALS